MVAEFATDEQMAQRTGGAITVTTHPTLEAELEAAQALIRGACGWHVAPPKALTERHSGPYMRDVWLPAMEITEVAAVTADGYPVDLALVRYDRDTGWTNLRGSSWEIDYTAGFTTVPPELTALTLQIAARALSSPTGVTREQIGQHSTSFALTAGQSSGGHVLLEAERQQLVPYTLGRLP